MHAIILSVGDELVLGQTVDTNSAYLSAQLAQRGIGTLYHQTVADDLPAIAECVALAAERAPLVIVTGGLGPTDDDLTRQALAQAMNEPLELHGPSVEAIASFFTARGRTMPERNRVQAMHPHGSEMIENICGTAPGIKAQIKGATFYVTPGVPSEMRAMWERSILPELTDTDGSRGVILTATVNTFGLGESAVADRLGSLMKRDRNPKVGTTVSGGIVGVRVRSEFRDGQQARRELDDTTAQVEHALGPIVFGRDDATIQESLVAMLRDRGLTVATAESCTGGLVGKMITDVPGSSRVYIGGWVTYAYAAKERELGVPHDMLMRHGAVCEPVARLMAQSALERSGADLAVSLTGVAGPDGGTPDKPVGTVWIGLARKSGEVEALCLNLPGDREMVRDRAAKSAAQLLRFALMGLPMETLAWGRRQPNIG